jgi:hypothetical protein
MNTERKVQPKFSIRWVLGALLLLATIGLFDRWLLTFPEREELGWTVARINAAQIDFDARGFAPFRFVGAWRLTSSDQRFGGISALAFDAGQLVALSDSGGIIRFSPSKRTARIGELPDGPGNNRFKINRDSEALVADPRGRGWWVSFENRDELWLYDRTFTQALQRIMLGKRPWRVNSGIEGMVAEGRSLLLLHEAGDNLIRVTETRARVMPIAGARRRLSDAVDVGGGRVLIVERQLTPFGFRNAMVELRRARDGYSLGRRYPLPLGRQDNVEGAAIEPLPDGGRRLWLMTDDNFHGRMRTLLIALDLPESVSGKSLSKD